MYLGWASCTAWRQGSSLHGLSPSLWSETLWWLVGLLFIVTVLSLLLEFSTDCYLQKFNLFETVAIKELYQKEFAELWLQTKLALWRQNVLLTREPYVCFPSSSPSTSLLISLQKETFQQGTKLKLRHLLRVLKLPSLPQKELLCSQAKASLKSASFPGQFCLDVRCTAFPSIVVS